VLGSRLWAVVSMGSAVELTDVRVTFGEVVALDGLSLSVSTGEIVGLLGPNGAGKTTTVDVCCGLRVPDAGTSSVLGADSVRAQKEVRKNIGVVPQDSGLYLELTAYEHLRLSAALYGLKDPDSRIDQMLQLMGLSDRRNKRVSTFSGGMRRRLALARSLLHDPPVLFLDEPTLGVDIQGRRVLWDHVAHLRDEGRSVLLTTNYLDEATALCDRVAIIDRGQLIAFESPSDLRREGGITVVLNCGAATPKVADLLRTRDDVAEVLETESSLRVRLTHDGAEAAVVEAAASVGKIIALRVEEPSLEDVFLNLTGRALRE
jgi:ABC-2 type transport system ATP-binding protein